MNRRNFLKILTYATAVSAINIPSFSDELQEDESEVYVADSLNIANVKNKEDIFLEKEFHEVFASVVKKLNLVQKHVGFGNFNVIGFDEAVKITKISPKIKRFTAEELDFMEYIFYSDPSNHGFYGAKTCFSITEEINKNDIYKVPYTGHYLFKDRSLETYNNMTKDIGDSIILTSGVRSVTKQMKLFLDKLNNTKLNISKASISLAPPAYSFHSSGDFDVGKKGFGYNNFTKKFAETEEFLKMIKLPYVDIRYTINNKDGVRYEPWHVTVV